MLIQFAHKIEQNKIVITLSNHIDDKVFCNEQPPSNYTPGRHYFSDPILWLIMNIYNIIELVKEAGNSG